MSNECVSSILLTRKNISFCGSSCPSSDPPYIADRCATSPCGSGYTCEVIVSGTKCTGKSPSSSIFLHTTSKLHIVKTLTILDCVADNVDVYSIIFNFHQFTFRRGHQSSTIHSPILHFTDINECQTGTPCGGNATCTNTIGNYTCACKSGYQGDPYAPSDCTGWSHNIIIIVI